MALTLPYPSMNFVPLDVLTAAEQNQLVANIEYIANQFPITSQNIDWSTSAITAKQKTLWSGTIADTTTIASLSEPIKSGYLYTITFLSLSSSFLCTYTFYGGSREHQFYQSDGTSYVRWRIAFSSDYNTARITTITTNLNNLALVALKDISRVVVGDFNQ